MSFAIEISCIFFCIEELIQESQNLLCYRFFIKRSDSFYVKTNKRGSTYENIKWIKRNVR
jgi:hypothetical protein